MTYDYDLAVIGGGAAGLTAAGIAANAGVRTLLVERAARPDGRARLGGDCTWTGCIPSKTLLHAAGVAQVIREGTPGLEGTEPTVDFAAVMAHVRATREHVFREADDPALYEGFGVEVVRGTARFINPNAVEIEGEQRRRVTGRFFVLCTGGRPALPPLDGLRDVPFYTSDTLFEIDRQPRHLLVLGAGPVGIEMAQAFARLGSEVTVVGRDRRILPRDDAAHAATLQAVLESEGVRFVLGAKATRVEREGDALLLYLDPLGAPLRGDALLIATGRRPNVEGLGLELAGVEYTEDGITVDDRCRTSRSHIYAAGDGTGAYQLTHMSEHMAKVAVTNAVLRLPMTVDHAHVPWVTYTDPELAHLGATEDELAGRGEKFEVYRFPYARLDRAITEGETVGEVKVLATTWTGTILGVSVLGARAGELIAIYAVAMKAGASLKTLADTIHPYPTYGLGARRAADQWYARKQFPLAVKALQKVFGYRGEVPPPPDPDRIV